MYKLQSKVKTTTENLNLANTPELCCLDLSSEVGEVSKEVLELTNYGKREHKYNPDLARELGDTLYSLISLANIYNINLETELNTSIDKYYKRESIRDPNERKVKLEPIVLAKNFLCLNSVVGCRNNCIYCYKHGWDINNKFKPQIIYPVNTILTNLKNHKYYHPNIPLAIHNSATDPFQKDVTEVTFDLLDGLEKMQVTNIVGLITKEYLSKRIIKKLEGYKYIRPIIFITYSCLPKKYEMVVVEKRLESMKNLSQSKLKCVLYYRPIITGVNDSRECVEKIVELGEKYFDCIVRSPIKLDLNTVEYMAQRGVFVDKRYDIGLNIHDSIKQMIPESRERVDGILKNAKIPYFKKTSCAISYLFNKPDYNTQWLRRDYYCSYSCPKKQQKICNKQKNHKLNINDIEALIKKIRLNAEYKIINNKVILYLDKVFYSDIKYMRMVLNSPVLVNIKGINYTAEEYDRKFVNIDRKEIRKQIKKIGINKY